MDSPPSVTKTCVLLLMNPSAPAWMPRTRSSLLLRVPAVIAWTRSLSSASASGVSISAEIHLSPCLLWNARIASYCASVRGTIPLKCHGLSRLRLKRRETAPLGGEGE